MYDVIILIIFIVLMAVVALLACNAPMVKFGGAEGDLLVKPADKSNVANCFYEKTTADQMTSGATGWLYEILPPQGGLESSQKRFRDYIRPALYAA